MNRVAGQRKKAVILLAFGGVDSIENVEPFVRNVLKGRPLSREAIEDIKERYRKIGGRSPLLEITTSQANALERRLKTLGNPLRVYVGMRYWHPYIRDTLERMKEDGVDEAVAIIMAPHSSRASTGGYREDVRSAVESLGGVPAVRFVGDWHTHPLFIDAVVERMEAVGGDLSRDDTVVVFTAHSLPVESLRDDPYVPRIEETIRRIRERIPFRYRIAYQSRGTGSIEWLGPYIEDTMEEIKKEGARRVVLVPIGFVADHVETLYDIDIVLKCRASSLGLEFVRTESLNTSDRFIDMLAEIVRKAL